MMSFSTATKGTRLGAAIAPTESDKLYVDFITPLLESFAALAADVDNASAFVQKSDVRAQLDSVYGAITALDDRLSTMDASDTQNWKADVLAAQGRINQLTNEFAVYTHVANKSALYSSAAGLFVGGVTGAIVYRRKKSKKWVVLASAGAAAVSGFTSWFLTRPKFE